MAMNINEKINVFIMWANENSWDITRKSEPHINLSGSIFSRYKEIPKEYLEFLSVVEKCVAPNEEAWFICEDEFNNSSDAAFKWNEYEWLSLEAAGDDSVYRSEITAWWDNYLPIVMSVSGGYSFYAIDLTHASGAIVRGCEPEFEEVERVANTFVEFLTLVMSNSVEFQL